MAKQHGGKRNCAGRKLVYDAPLDRFTIRLSKKQVEAVLKWGRDLSEGVRIAIDEKIKKET